MDKRELLNKIIEITNNLHSVYINKTNDYSIVTPQDFNVGAIQVTNEATTIPKGKIRIWINKEELEYKEIEDTIEGVLSFLEYSLNNIIEISYKTGQNNLRSTIQELLGLSFNSLAFVTLEVITWNLLLLMIKNQT
jgi:hypothetical protein